MTPPIANFSDFSKQVLRSFDQAKQFAQEKMGTAEETTNYPLAYIQLDEKVDKIKVVFDGLLRVTKQMLTSDDYSPPLGDSFMDAIDTLNVKFDKFRNRDSVPSEPRAPLTVQHATAEICIEGADLLTRDSTLPSDDPAADLLQRYGQIESKLGEARLEFNRTLTRKFIEPFSTYTGAYDNATRARRATQRVRLELDACKGKLRSIRGPRPVELQSQVDLLEKEFSNSCDEAIQEMKAFIQYTEATHCIEALIQAQVIYHRKASEILAALN